MTFAEGETAASPGRAGRTAHGTIPRRSSKAGPFTAPTTGATGYVCRLTTGGMETGYLLADALGGGACTGAYSFTGIPAYEGLAEEGGGTASEERLYFFGGISYGVRLRTELPADGLSGKGERAETAAEQYRHTVEQVQRQRAE